MKDHSFRTTLLIIVVTLLLVMAISCSRKQTGETIKASATKASIERVTAGPVDDFYEATGIVRSKTTNALSSKSFGRIVAVQVHEGERVRAGQLLVEIDSRDAVAELQKAQGGVREAENALEEVDRNIRAAEAAKAAAEANLTLAGSTHARYQKLLERRSASPQEFDEVATRFKVAEAEVERTTRMLASLYARRNQASAKIDQAKSEVAAAHVYASYSRVTSPINGIVTAKQAETGSMAVPGAVLITVEDNSHYRLEASVEESQLHRIKIGAEAGIQVDALGDEELPGRVSEIVPVADAASRSYTVKIDLPPRSTFRSGLYGKARFAREQRHAITIPTKAIIQRGQLTSVLLVDDSGTARFRLISVGKSRGDRTEVLSGLQEGERIVVDRLDAISDGSRVES